MGTGEEAVALFADRGHEQDGRRPAFTSDKPADGAERGQSHAVIPHAGAHQTVAGPAHYVLGL